MLYSPTDAPLRTRSRLDQGYTAQALREAGTDFVVYDPELADDDVVILHSQFCWDEQSQAVSIACTSGLCHREQPRPRKWCFPRFELAVAFHSPGLPLEVLRGLLLFARDLREWTALP